MAVIITKITGIGGNPPTHIRVEGTVTGCEMLDVESSCSTIRMPVGIPSGGFNQWLIDLPNSRNCACGASVQVTAYCNLGAPNAAIVKATLGLLCEICPTVIITADPPGPCVNGKRSVTFHASVNGIPATGAVLQWSFPNSSQPSTTAFLVMNNGPLPDQIVEYTANVSGSIAQTASLQTILPANCPPAPVSVTSVTIDPCPSCCPGITLSQPTVTGCAPASAVVSFTAVLTWPTGCTPVTPLSYEWTLNGPSGKKYQRSTSQPNTDTRAPWTDVASGNPVTVQFASGGNYSISVTAVIRGVALPCNPTDTKAFPVSACCPQLIGPLNASQKPGDPCTWIFSAQVSNPNNAAVTFEWSFHDGTTATTSLPQVEHTYTPGSITTGTTTVTLKSPRCPDENLTVTVTHTCLCPPGQHRDSSGNCVPDTPPPPPPPPPPSGGGGCGCIVLLILALLFLVAGAIVIVVAACVPTPVSVLGIVVGVVLALIGLGLLILWGALCASLMCRILNTLAWVFSFLVSISVLLAAIFAITGNLPCAGGWLADAAIWGVALSIVGWISSFTGCRIFTRPIF
ncbi:MAG: hypothetical protein HY083_04985 [Gammaproteobacteria bacterium]|nr:hypothetical protein [Gammaproteobacteria bacterium]